MRFVKAFAGQMNCHVDMLTGQCLINKYGFTVGRMGNATTIMR